MFLGQTLNVDTRLPLAHPQRVEHRHLAPGRESHPSPLLVRRVLFPYLVISEEVDDLFVVDLEVGDCNVPALQLRLLEELLAQARDQAALVWRFAPEHSVRLAGPGLAVREDGRIEPVAHLLQHRRAERVVHVLLSVVPVEDVVKREALGLVRLGAVHEAEAQRVLRTWPIPHDRLRAVGGLDTHRHCNVCVLAAGLPLRPLLCSIILRRRCL